MCVSVGEEVWVGVGVGECVCVGVWQTMGILYIQMCTYVRLCLGRICVGGFVELTLSVN